MLAGADMAGPNDAADTSNWRTFDTIAPPHRSPHWTKPEALEHVSPGGWLGVAESAWRDALRASVQAPPDPGVDCAHQRHCRGVRAQGGSSGRPRRPGARAVVAAPVRAAGRPIVLRAPARRQSTGISRARLRFDRAVDELGRATAETPCQPSGRRSRMSRWFCTTSLTRCSSRKAGDGRPHLMSRTQATRTPPRSRMTRDLNRTAAWSAIRCGRRTRLRSRSSGRSPRPHRLFLILSPSWWHLTTRPRRIRSRSQLQSRVGVGLRAGGADGHQAIATSIGRSMITEGVVPGRATLRVARFIGLLGIVSLPAVEVRLTSISVWYGGTSQSSRPPVG